MKRSERLLRMAKTMYEASEDAEEAGDAVRAVELMAGARELEQRAAEAAELEDE